MTNTATSTTPKAPTVHLTDDISSIIDGASANGTPVAVAYVDSAGTPHLSLRGTVQVLGPTRLALWARSNGLPDALSANPNVALLYQNLAAHTVYQFTGRARVEPDETVRGQVFDGSSEREQAYDPERRGAAIIVELDTVDGMAPSGRVHMARRDPKAELA